METPKITIMNLFQTSRGSMRSRKKKVLYFQIENKISRYF
jgi:hypothetical protein